MQKQQQSTLFAFKLADKQHQDAKPAQEWKVREGVSLAGCTDAGGLHGNMYRDASRWNGPDGGIYC